MSVITSASAQRRIVYDRKATVAARLAALATFDQPSLLMLTTLLRDKKLPARLRVKATELLEDALVLAEARKEESL